MTTLAVRNELHFLIDRADDNVLQKMYSYLKENEIVGFRCGKSINKNQLAEELKIAENQIRNGDFISIEDLEKEAENW